MSLSFRLFCSWLAIGLHLPATSGGADPSAEALWRMSVRNRSALKSANIQLSVERRRVGRDDAVKELEGSVLQHHIRFDEDRIRVDRREQRPRNPESAQNSRFAYDAGVYRLIQSPDPKRAAHELIAGAQLPERLESPSLTAHFVKRMWIDPRVIGFYPNAFESLAGLSLSSAEALIDYPAHTDVVRDPDAGEHVVLVWTYSNGTTRRSFTLDPARGYVPVHVEWVGIPSPGVVLRDSLECSWQEVTLQKQHAGPMIYFPAEVVYRRHEDDALLEHEIWTTTSISEINERMPEDIFGWNGLRLPAGAVVVREGHGVQGRQVVEWTGNSFGKWEPTQLGERLPQLEPLRDEGRIRLFLATANLALGVILFMAWFIYLRFYRSRST